MDEYKLKCDKINLLTTVRHDGVDKLVVAICLGYVLLMECTKSELFEKNGFFNYPDEWIDLDDIILYETTPRREVFVSATTGCTSTKT